MEFCANARTTPDWALNNPHSSRPPSIPSSPSFLFHTLTRLSLPAVSSSSGSFFSASRTTHSMHRTDTSRCLGAQIFSATITKKIYSQYLEAHCQVNLSAPVLFIYTQHTCEAFFSPIYSDTIHKSAACTPSCV